MNPTEVTSEKDLATTATLPSVQETLTNFQESQLMLVAQRIRDIESNLMVRLIDQIESMDRGTSDQRLELYSLGAGLNSIRIRLERMAEENERVRLMLLKVSQSHGRDHSINTNKSA